jgi:hypothetical protein
MSLATYSVVNDLPAPVTTGTTIQSFTDPSGEVWVAKNTVNGGAWKKARDVLVAAVYRNTTWGPFTGTATVIQFDSTYRDVYGMWGGSPNWGIIAPIPGWYRVHAQVYGSSASASSYISISIWQNTVQRTVGNVISPLTSGGIPTRGWWSGQLNALDYVSVRAAQGGTGANMSLGFANNRLEVTYLGTG